MSGGRVTFIFDDAYESIYRNALPLFRAYNAPACLAVPSGYYFAPTLKDRIKRLVPGHRKISLHRLHELQNLGWEIMSHTVTHPRLTEVPPEKVEEELSLSREQLTQAGFRVRQFVSPYTVFPENQIQLIGKYYDAHYGNYGQRDINDPAQVTNTSASDPLHLQRINFHPYPMDLINSWLDYTADTGCWLVLYEHQIGYRDFSPAGKLKEILEGIRKRNLQVQTGTDAWKAVRGL